MSYQDHQSHNIKNNFIYESRGKFLGTQKKHSLKSIFGKAKDYLVLFFETSSIHGLNHLVIDGRHPCEILLWLFMVAISSYGSVYLSWATWIRYQNSPTVVSLDRDMLSWNTTFPAVTLCPEKKLDLDKFDAFLQNTKEADRDTVDLFIRTLSNATFDNFDQIPEYHGIPPEKYLDTLVSLTSTFEPSLSIGLPGSNLNNIKIIPTVTEMGICYAFNSKVAIYTSPEYIAANRWDIVDAKIEIFFVHPLDGEVFAQVVRIPCGYNAYLHGPFEIPEITTKFHHSEKAFYLKLFVTATAIYTTPEAAKLTVAQRRCRFIHENNLQHFPIYTYIMCRMECRIRLCLQYCQCIPFFYRRKGDEKICDVKGMHCLVKYKDELNILKGKPGQKIDCDCFPICDDVNYVIQSNSLLEWLLGTNLQWGMVSYPRIRFRRDIIFAFTDVLVAVGGMAGLFLGCSVLSFLEIAYFLTIRLFCYTYSSSDK